MGGSPPFPLLVFWHPFVPSPFVDLGLWLACNPERVPLSTLPLKLQKPPNGRAAQSDVHTLSLRQCDTSDACPVVAVAGGRSEKFLDLTTNDPKNHTSSADSLRLQPFSICDLFIHERGDGVWGLGGMREMVQHRAQTRTIQWPCTSDLPAALAMALDWMVQVVLVSIQSDIKMGSYDTLVWAFTLNKPKNNVVVITLGVTHISAIQWHGPVVQPEATEPSSYGQINQLNAGSIPQA
ncbi:hypothetical protein DFH08DRAFT_1029356 [Mycena albidolilacea]|uniref:Uncharacterized protein n=1 Tax=Mycena albidolilacea TaxID=1033008 RepID=A0AAD6ZIG4_9AGAR|nr:hypothetical protein DFH08DRAFT_1029356 [Mycena albidolilacea]